MYNNETLTLSAITPATNPLAPDTWEYIGIQDALMVFRHAQGHYACYPLAAYGPMFAAVLEKGAGARCTITATYSQNNFGKEQKGLIVRLMDKFNK